MNKLKGVSLSIETVIIIIVCVLVLAVIVLFFMGVFKLPSEGVYSEAELTAECMDWSHYSYDFEKFETLCPKLNDTYKIAIVAKNWCTSRIAASYIECDNNYCGSEDPPSDTPDWVCCCKGKDKDTDCPKRDDCNWAPACG